MHVRNKEIKLEGFDSDFTKCDREFLSKIALLTAVKSSALGICQTRTGKNKSKPIPEQLEFPIR